MPVTTKTVPHHQVVLKLGPSVQSATGANSGLFVGSVPDLNATLDNAAPT